MARKRKTWRFRLNDTTALEVSAKARATEKQVRRRGRWSIILGTLMAVGALAASGAMADGIAGDTDALATASPNANGLDANQTIGTTVSYDYSAYVNNTGTAANDVFANTGDTVGASVSIIQNSLGWTASVDTQFTASNAFTAYNQNKPGMLSVTVPNSASAGDIDHIQIKIQATASNGKSMSPDSVTLNYNITAAAATNSAPIIDSLGTFSGNEGSDINLTATAHDPDGDPLTYSWALDTTGGDSGISCPITDADNTNAAASVKCNDDSNAGTFKLTLSVSDDHSHTTSRDTTLDVDNVAPAFNSGKPAFAASNVTCANRNVTLDFGYSDAGSNDTQTASIDWGDGNTSNLTAAQTAIGSASHQYNSGGPYTAKVNVTDDDAGSTGDTNSTNSLVVQYNMSSILQPVNDTRNGQLVSMFKYGSVVPVKVEITDCDGAHPANLDVRVFYALFSGSPPAAGDDEAALAIQADAGNQARFSDPIYIYNWSTKKVNDPSSTVRLTVKIMNGSTVLQSTYSDIGLKK